MQIILTLSFNILAENQLIWYKYGSINATIFEVWTSRYSSYYRLSLLFVLNMENLWNYQIISSKQPRLHLKKKSKIIFTKFTALLIDYYVKEAQILSILVWQIPQCTKKWTISTIENVCTFRSLKFTNSNSGAVHILYKHIFGFFDPPPFPLMSTHKIWTPRPLSADLYLKFN